MPRLCELAEKEVPSFCGIEFASGELDEGVACLKPGRTVLLGADTVLTGGLALGFESAILTTLNVFPGLPQKIFEHMHNNNVQEANAVQIQLNERIHKICPRGGDFVQTMKTEFNKISTGFHTGPCRKPAVYAKDQ